MAEQVDGAKPVDGAPAQELPSRPAKQPKEKVAKDKAPKGGNKNAALEVCDKPPSLADRLLRIAFRRIFSG